MKKIAASKAKLHFGEMLDIVQQEPVIIQRSGRDKAVVLSMRDFERITEDRYWGEKALKAEREGKFLSAKESEKLLKSTRGATP